MMQAQLENATLDDLMHFDGKAELIDGRIVPMMAAGHLPNRAGGRIYASLLAYCDQTRAGQPYMDNMGFAVPRLHSGRQSFSPDVSFYAGNPPLNPMRFIEGPPTFAVEARSECDYEAGAEEDRLAKRADYFEAGTLVVWDVDVQGKCIYAYYRSSPYTKQTFVPGQIADAEPAVPGWRIEVDKIFAV